MPGEMGGKGDPRGLVAGLALLPPWTLVAALPDMPFASVARSTTAVPLLVVLASTVGVKRQRRVNVGHLWWYLALLMVPFVGSTTDAGRALALQCEWFLLVVTALRVVRVSTAERVQSQVIPALAYGLAACTAVLAYGFATGQVANVSNRFAPWEANPNVIALPLVAATGLGLIMAQSSRRWYVVTSTASVLVLLTGSRASLIALVVVYVPVLLLTRRRKQTLVGLLLAAVVIGSYADFGPAVDRSRTLTSRRSEITAKYISSISERPLGLFGTQGMATAHDPDILSVWGDPEGPHNWWLAIGYQGGMVLVGLHFVLAALSIHVGIRRARSSRPDAMLFALLVAVYASSFTSVACGYPSQFWAFLHVLISALFLSRHHAEIRPRVTRAAWMPAASTVTPVGLATGSAP